MKSKIQKILKEEVLALLKEEDSKIEYVVKVAGQNYKLNFDINRNPTKKGIKLHFTPQDSSTATDPKKRNEAVNRLQDSLDKKLVKVGLQADYDQDVPMSNVIGFYIKLGDLSDFIIKTLKS